MADVTPLTPQEEAAFQAWVRENQIRDLDHPQSKYDYRGYWKDIASKGEDRTQILKDGRHYPDTYKQHGHPTFSVESQYSRGLQDGGQWLGEGDAAVLMPPPMPSHRQFQRNALLQLMQKGGR